MRRCPTDSAATIAATGYDGKHRLDIGRSHIAARLTITDYFDRFTHDTLGSYHFHCSGRLHGNVALAGEARRRAAPRRRALYSFRKEDLSAVCLDLAAVLAGRCSRAPASMSEGMQMVTVAIPKDKP